MDTLVIERGPGRPAMRIDVQPARPRRRLARIARRMRAAGIADYAIAQALRCNRKRLADALAGNDLFAAPMRALIAELAGEQNGNKA